MLPHLPCVPCFQMALNNLGVSPQGHQGSAGLHSLKVWGFGFFSLGLPRIVFPKLRASLKQTATVTRA